MAQLRKLSPEEIAVILVSGDFDKLVPSVEHEQVECKAGLYQFKDELGKVELAKDVSALANAKGGCVLLGVSTKRNPTHRGDEIESISCFEQVRFDADQYRKILEGLIYPPVRGLELSWHASSSDPSRGIASINVTAKSCSDQPYLVALTDVGQKASGKLFGYYERIESDALPISVHELRERFKDGLRFKDLDCRLESIEKTLARQSGESSEKNSAVKVDRLTQRARDARVAMGTAEEPTFSILAEPIEDVRFPRIFESAVSPEAKLFETPPSYRTGGFDLRTTNRSEIVRAELLRRQSEGIRGLELWRDGSLIFVGRGDFWVLGWSCSATPIPTLPINNIVLTETVCLFFRLAIELFQLAEPRVARVKSLFQLTVPKGTERKYTLTAANLMAPPIFASDWRSAPEQEAEFEMGFDLDGAVAEVEAYKLLKEIYNWFGFTDNQIPYVDRKSVPPRIDPKSFDRQIQSSP